MSRLLPLAALLGASLPAMAQNFDPPPSKTPDAETLKEIEKKTAELRQAVADVAKGLPEIHRADLEVYVKAAEWNVRHSEWYTADSGKQTLAVINQGLQRCELAQGGKSPWLEPAGRSVARGYRSAVDESVQPYGVVYPAGYGADPKKKWRLDVSLHGRDSSISEVKHLNQHADRPAPKDQEFVQLNIFGRGNNAYRWAGEADVFEAVAHFLAAEAALGRKDLIDLRRVVLKGFSMGGAGTWHLGLRYPGRFAALQPGAGFVNTHGYIDKLPDPLPEPQEATLRIYDAYWYAENAFNVPVVAYSGEKDKQKAAADGIEAELARLKLSDRMVHLVAPGLPHQFPAEWQKKTEAELRKHVGDGKGRDPYPARVRFVTYTLKQHQCAWVAIGGLDKHYERAVVDASFDGTGYTVKTENVRRLMLLGPDKDTVPRNVSIDGQPVAPAKAGLFPGHAQAHFHKVDGKWAAEDPTTPLPAQKVPGLQGPIDDAFCGPFLCVEGTGTPWNQAIQRSAQAQLDRFRREWDKYLRGSLPVKKDTEVTDGDLERYHLVLFGDPGSNSLIARALPALPIKWTEKTLDVAGTEYDAATHMPVLIHPGRFGPNRYVVLNSGHTFHEAEFRGTNAQLYPRLGDWAVLKPTPSVRDAAAAEVMTAGLFDESWKFPKK